MGVQFVVLLCKGLVYEKIIDVAYFFLKKKKKRKKMHTKNKRKNEGRKYGTLFACCVEAIHSVVYLAPLTLVLVLKLSCLLCF